MNGILNVYKEKGYTSHDVVAKLRGICHQKKIGHTGTLDPDAEGVLPVCLGTAAKVCSLITDKDKEYEAVLLLGIQTDTQDISGKVQKEAAADCTQQQVQEAVRSFEGVYEQVPPMYSALKVNGRKLCDLARAGIEVERRPRQVQIYKITIEWIELPRVKMTVHCSKGTYIRTLCHDIGQKLGCGGCMEELLRTRSGIFTVDAAVKLSKIEELADSGRLQEILLPVDRLFFEYPKAAVKAEFQKMLANGNRLPQHAFCIENAAEAAESEPAGLQAAGQILSCETLRVYMEEDFFGIYAWDARRKDYKPVKIFGRENPAGR
ncbi:MAG: tRNA pseudouridine(55) synthase TruB [Eubacterium sp.]|jgi:tRNA pseudouridine55 synthase|nr:tRNA pseudouridine(55) synthase TruB [Eubacterium sp.]